MRDIQEWGEPTPPKDFDELALVMASGRTGIVLLLEILPPWPLQMRWLDHQVRLLSPDAVRRPAGESVLAVLLPEASVAEGWQLKEQLFDRARAHHVALFTGLASWPVQGSTPMDVLAAAAAALIDEQSSFRESMGEEVRLDLDGMQLALGIAGEFLTG